jgi:beta-lactamase class A
MCSTFKRALAGAVLAEVDRGARSWRKRADRQSRPRSLRAVVTANLDKGSVSLETLCAAARRGERQCSREPSLEPHRRPAASPAFVRRCGDKVTRLDRTETELNSNIPGDPRGHHDAGSDAGLMRNLCSAGC